MVLEFRKGIRTNQCCVKMTVKEMLLMAVEKMETEKTYDIWITDFSKRDILHAEGVGNFYSCRNWEMKKEVYISSLRREQDHICLSYYSVEDQIVEPIIEAEEILTKVFAIY